MRFEWDEEKNRSNLRKHEVDFVTATRVFEDPHYLTEQDREIDGEERWQTIGRIDNVLVLLVAHTILDDDNDLACRVISARRATTHERRRYEANTN